MIFLTMIFKQNVQIIKFQHLLFQLNSLCKETATMFTVYSLNSDLDSEKTDILNVR